MPRVMILAWFIIPCAVAAAEIRPTVEIRLPPMREATKYFEYIASLGGEADQGRMLADFVQAFGGAKGVIQGIDLKRPLGAYAVISDKLTASQIILMLPVADQSAVLKLLESQLGLTPKDEGNGTYGLRVPNLPFPLYFRFHKDYAYLTVWDAGHLKPETLMNPADFFAKQDAALLELKIWFDRIPVELRQQGIDQVERLFKGWLDADQVGGAAGELRDWLVLEGGVRATRSLLEEGRCLALQLRLKPETDDITLDAVFQAREGSSLAATLRALPQRPAQAALVAAGLEHPVASLALQVGLPDSMLNEFARRMDAWLDETAAGDPVFLGHLLDAIRPTLRAGGYELGLALHGAVGQFQLIAAMRAVEPKKIDKMIREFAGFVPETEARVQFDVAKVDCGVLHKLELNNEDLERLYGSEVVWAGHTDSMVLLGFGNNADALKRAMAAKPEAADLLAATISWSRFIPLIEQNIETDDLQRLTAEVFGESPPPGADESSLTVRGGNELSVRLQTKGKAIIYIGQIDRLKKQD